MNNLYRNKQSKELAVANLLNHDKKEKRNIYKVTTLNDLYSSLMVERKFVFLYEKVEEPTVVTLHFNKELDAAK